MAALHQAARRAAATRRRRLLEERLAARGDEPTPSPSPVTVDLSGPAPVAEVAFPPAPVAPARGESRTAATFAAIALIVTAGLALRAIRHEIDGEPLAIAKGAWAAALVHAASLSAREPAPAAEPAPPPAEAPPVEGPRADEHVKRSGYASIPGGVLFVPSTFGSADGTYDLYLHFHGNTRVVLESAEYANLDAAVAVVNLGVNSAPYLDAYAVPGTYEALLGSIDRALGERGLARPKLRRVALGSWSGGYGAISTIFERRRGTDPLDALLVLDGIHCGFLEENRKALNVRILMPFLGAARRAAAGDILFSITHSEIDPIDYAGTDLTAGYLLDAVHGRRGAPLSVPEHVQLRAAEGAVAKKLEKSMEPVSEASVGTFHVRGYRGNTPEHHMAHLLQMGATVLPELARRWRSHE